MYKSSPATQAYKTLEPTGQITTAEVALVAIVLKAQDLQIVSQPQAPQQSTTINVHNVQVNNYNCPPPEAPKQGHSGSSQDTHLQRLQTTVSASQAIEDKAHGMNNSPSVPNTTRNLQHKTQNASGDNVSSARAIKHQTHQIQNKSGVETKSAPVIRPATAQAPSKLPQGGRKNVFPATVSSSQGQVQKQVHKEGSQPKKSIVESFIASFSHSDSNHKNGSQHRGNAPTSATIPLARNSINNRQSGRGVSPFVDQPIGQDHPRPARHNWQAPTQSVRHPAPHNSVLSTHPGASQSSRRGATVGVSQSRTPVNKSRDERAEAVPELKALSEKVIRKYLACLDSLIGKHQSKTSSSPARLIVIGKASAEMMALKITEKAYYIDVMLDLRATDERLAHIRRCMTQARVFREFEGPGLATNKASKTIFGTNQQRDAVFDDVVGEDKSVHNGVHLKAYVMDTERAFEFELRRWAETESKRTKDTSFDIVTAIWRGNIASGFEAPSPSSCRNLKHIKADAPVPISNKEFEELFEQRHEKKGIVGS